MEFNLADLWERVVDAVPADREALVCGDRRLTYRALDERANRLAHALADRGVGAGDHVAVYLRNSSEYLEVMLAAFKLRAVPVNVNYRYVADELRYLLDDADAVAVVLDREFAPTLAATRSGLPALQVCLVVGGDDPVDADAGAVAALDGVATALDGVATALDGVTTALDGVTTALDCVTTALDCVEYEAALAGASPVRDFPARSADDLYILYTGGTTGMPKGVMWRHEDVFFGAFGGGAAGADPITEPDAIAQRCLVSHTRCLPACPFMHGTAHWMAFMTLYGGGTVVVAPEHHFDARRLWALVAREHVSFLVIVGDAFARPLVEALGAGGVDPATVADCAVILSGGAILSSAVKRQLAQRLPGTLVVDGYGASETGGQGQSVTVAGGEVPTAPRFRVDSATRVLSPADLRPLPVGRVGLLARRGHIPLGYYGDPEKSAATFPTVDGVRWSVPGDHAIAEADGTITLLGRGSGSINTGGEKVYPEEVEAALKAHPDVFDAVVVGVPDERWGERVVAVVEARPGTTPSLRVLAPHVREHLAGFKAPRDLVTVDAIVRSPTGKPDYRWARRVATGDRDPEAPG